MAEGEPAAEPKKVVHIYPLVENSDMSEDMKNEAIELIVTACEKYSTNNEKTGGAWSLFLSYSLSVHKAHFFWQLTIFIILFFFCKEKEYPAWSLRGQVIAMLGCKNPLSSDQILFLKKWIRLL
ncbi:dynein axonemal light chain 4 isoform X1 [Halyomorpha halys]|uniref:dynein axonemal light chain 4 isoform X1 n=1 Tax=Halyomorpha halys TaxID=286706 RepID=UPI0006D52137|nr:dynein light chain 4, axonemal isoform X1 [Halyomorpha halys]